MYLSLASCVRVCVCACAQSGLTLCDPMDCSPPHTSVHGVSQARILEWVATSFSGVSSQTRDRTGLSCIGRWILSQRATREALYKRATNSYTSQNQADEEMCELSWLRLCGRVGTGSEWRMLAAAKSLQSCPTLCDPIDGSPPGSSVPGILQARTLEWVAISFSNA